MNMNFNPVGRRFALAPLQIENNGTLSLARLPSELARSAMRMRTLLTFLYDNNALASKGGPITNEFGTYEVWLPSWYAHVAIERDLSVVYSYLQGAQLVLSPSMPGALLIHVDEDDQMVSWGTFRRPVLILQHGWKPSDLNTEFEFSRTWLNEREGLRQKLAAIWLSAATQSDGNGEAAE